LDNNLNTKESLHRLHLYGRRKGKPLKPKAQLLFDRDFPIFNLTLKDLTTKSPKDWFNSQEINRIWLEIGFGSGENIIELAKNNPSVGFIGVEVFHNGIAAFLKHRAKYGLKNLIVYNGDARHFLEVVPKNSIEDVFILYPDPWPKKRHAKRRLICKKTLDDLTNVMKIGAKLYLATDHPTYIKWCLQQVPPHPRFKWHVESPSSCNTRPPCIVTTRYEKKAKQQGRRSIYLTFSRI
jgi:tRNA (guanine-N7-)-methyltransferase